MNIAVPTQSRNTVYVSVLVLLSVVLWIPRLRGPLDLRYDAGVYYVLGAALAEGKGYLLLNEPGEIAAIQYPPLLSLFAAAHQRVAGSSDPAVAGHLLRLSFFAIFLAFIVAVYRLSRHYLTSGWAFLATLLVLLHLNTTLLSELLSSELPFALLSVLFLLTMRSAKPSREWLAGVLAVLCFLLRSTGIALLGAWIGESLLRRRFREMAVRTTVALVPLLAWQGYIAHVKGGVEYTEPAYEYQRAGYQHYNVGYTENLSYVDPFVPEMGSASLAFLLERTTRHVVHLPQDLGAAVSVDANWLNYWSRRATEPFGIPWGAIYLAGVFHFVLSALVVSGLVLMAVRGAWLLAFYVVGSFGLICLTPWSEQFGRYLWPLTPLLAIALFTSLVMVKDRLSTSAQGRLRIAASAIVALVALSVFAIESVTLRSLYRKMDSAYYRDQNGKPHEYNLAFYRPAWRDYDEALDWLDGHATPREIVVASAPHWIYLKTGLQSVMPPFEPDVHEAQRLMDSIPVRYLIVDGLEHRDFIRRYAQPVVEAFPEQWELIYAPAKKDSRIYRRRIQSETANQSSRRQ